MNFPSNQVTIKPVSADRVVTAMLPAHNIRYVPSRSEQLLTKRRAVDFLRVATAMCPRPVHFVA